MVSPRDVSSNYSNLNSNVSKKSDNNSVSSVPNYKTTQDMYFSNNDHENKRNDSRDFHSKLPVYEEDETLKLSKSISDSETKSKSKQKRDGENRHSVRKNILNLPKTPLCYLEICRKIQDGCSNRCRCMKCVPGQSRYYCSCYDAICNDLEEESEVEMDKHKHIFKDLNTRRNYYYPFNPKKRSCDEPCNICKQRKCKCAFQSRPRIQRSPPT